ncbi:MAG: Amuc_1098 family type IV pilus outer membrane protein [Chthoniobacteraceae bacterium]
MIKSPPALTIAAVLGLALQAMIPTAAHGQSAQSAAEREQARRRDYVRRGEDSLKTAGQAMKDKDYEKAVSFYKLACDLVPNSPNTHGLYAEAISGFCKSSVRYAEQRIAEGRYGDAQTQLQLVLDERYNPRCKDAVVILSRLETPGYYNQTIGPKFRGKVEEVKKFLLEAQGFEESGRWDMATKRYDQVLNLDKYNIAAREGQERAALQKNQYGEVAYNQTRGEMLWQVQGAWQRPVRKFAAPNETFIYSTDTDAAGTARINAKLQKIIIPKLELRDATIVEALEFLKKKSTELDTDPDIARRGVSFVLKLEGSGGGGGAAAFQPAPMAPAAPAIPGLEAIPGAAPVAPVAVAPAAPVGGGVSPADARISVALTNIPLLEALKYVTSLANLKYKVEPYAVAVVPMGVSTVELIQKEYKVPPGFITRISTGGGEAAGALAPPPPGGGDATRGGAAITGKIDANEFLKTSGVTFPEGATAIYIPISSRLIVRNTQENLDLIDQLVQAFSVGGPTQVEIEAKFVEITQQNLKELSFDWLLGQSNVPGGQKIFSGGGTSGNTPQLAPADFGFVAPGGTPVGANPVTGGNRSGNLAISANAIDSLLFGRAGASALAPGVLSLAGVFTDPAFQVVVRALNQQKGVDLLSAPRVTTKSGNRAVIEIIREFRYPTEFDPPQIPQNFGNTGNGGGGGAGVTVNLPGSFPVTPTTPTAFETRNTGVTLEVEPVVGPDGYTIDLNLAPQVVEFEGFINYGSPITSSGVNILTGATTQNVITPNVINQPIFSTRKVTTSVSIFDGQTVVLGGLMREDVQKVEDKTPFLGDIPLIGRLFRSSVDQHLKRNLVIFVSARLMNPAGEPVRSDEEAEEEFVPQPPPEAVSPLPDLPLMPKR